MQRYRVNFRLLTILLVSGVLASAGAYLLWKFQINRNATQLLARADAAEAEGDLEDAFDDLYQFTRLRKDDDAARIRLASVAEKLVLKPDIDNVVRYSAYNILQDTVVRTENDELRRKLVDVQLQFGQWDTALQNAQTLLDQGIDDKDLKVTKARCLFLTQKSAEAADYSYELIGYDRSQDKFDAAKAQVPDEPLIYAQLAGYLMQNRQPELARRIVDQMTEANAESKDAWLFRHTLLKALEEPDLATEALAKAYEIDPDDAGVLDAKGLQELAAFQADKRDEINAALPEEERKAKGDSAAQHLKAASEFYGQALEKFPERADFYERVARIYVLSARLEEALRTAQAGLEKFPLKSSLNARGIPLAIGLENLKFEVLFSQKKLDDVLAEAKALRALKNPRIAPLAEFQEARVEAVRENWPEAAKKMASVRTRLVDFPEIQATAAFFQGFCHERLGQVDLALEAFEWAANKNPELEQAVVAAEEARRKLQPTSSDVNLTEVDRLVGEMLALPAAQQNWSSVDEKIDGFIERLGTERNQSRAWIEARKELLHAQSYVLRGEAAQTNEQKQELYQQAREAVKRAYAADSKDVVVILAAVRLLMTEPGSGPEKALQLLDRIVKRDGDTPAYRIARGDIYMAMGGEDLPMRLVGVSENLPEAWTSGQRAEVWSAVAGQFERLGQFSEAIRCMKEATALAPSNLPARLALFNLALKMGDDAAMKEAQQEVLSVVGDETDPDYVLTEVKRKIMQFTRGEIDAAAMDPVRKMLADAIKKRPTYADLYVTQGQIALAVDNDVDAALQAFDAGLERGQTNSAAVALQIRLLAEKGRFQEARGRLERLPVGVWTAALGRFAPMILAQTGEADRAVVEAERVAAATPEDFDTQSWLGDLALAARKFDVAERAYQKAMILRPGDPEAWTRLVNVYLELKQGDDVELTLRRAQIALEEEYLPLVTGKYYELLGRWQQAEDIYLSVYAGRDDEMPLNRRMAEFYLLWSAKDPTNVNKAAIYVNRILRAAHEGKIAGDDPHAAWARRQGSRLLSLAGDYQKSLIAERILLQGVSDERKLPPEDMQQLIDVLDRRGDPASRQRQAELLQLIQRTAGLPPDKELMLGQALDGYGEWDQAKTQMENAIAKFPEASALREAYVDMLIRHRELDAADRWLVRFNELPGVKPEQTYDLRLRLAAARGNKEVLRQQLERMTPNVQGAITPEQLKSLRSLAFAAEGLGDHEYAVKLMRDFSRRSPGAELDMARMLALYGDRAEAINILKQQLENNPDQVVTLAVEMLRTRRKEDPQTLDEELGRMVRWARREDPESARFMMLEAEMLEVQENFDDSIAAYKTVMNLDDAPLFIRATAANNLAFLLAMKRQETDQAIEAANVAVELLGPISDVLDTRGLAYLADGRNQEAVEDFRLAVRSGPTPSKYFHLTEALLAAGDEKGAREAWQGGLELGLDATKVSELERDEFQAVEQKVGGSAS